MILLLELWSVIAQFDNNILSKILCLNIAIYDLCKPALRSRETLLQSPTSAHFIYEKKIIYDMFKKLKYGNLETKQNIFKILNKDYAYATAFTCVSKQMWFDYMDEFFYERKLENEYEYASEGYDYQNETFELEMSGNF